MKPNPGDGLLLHRHIPPLTRRYMAYFCSGAHTRYSETGEYQILVSKDRAGHEPVAKGLGEAVETKGKVLVSVKLDLRSAKPGSYFLATVRGSDNGTYYYPLEVK